MTSPKLEALSSKQVPISNDSNKKKYDLDRRTYLFAKACREYVSTLPKTVQNLEDSKQLIRSSGSVAANYLEAAESLSKKDFLLRIKIAKKRREKVFCG